MEIESLITIKQNEQCPKNFNAVLLSSGPFNMPSFQYWNKSSDEKFEILIFGTLIPPTFHFWTKLAANFAQQEHLN